MGAEVHGPPVEPPAPPLPPFTHLSQQPRSLLLQGQVLVPTEQRAHPGARHACQLLRTDTGRVPQHGSLDPS